MEQTDALELAHFFLAVGFTHRFSLQLRVSWRRWGFVSWQLPPRHTDKEHLKGMWNQGVVWTCLITRKVRDKVTGLVRGLRPTSTHVVLPHDSQSRGRARHCACRLLCGQTVGRRCTSLSLQISPPRLEHHTLKITISQ